MSLSTLPFFLATIFITFSLLQTPGFAAKEIYIVYLGSHSNLHDNSHTVSKVENLHRELLGSLLGSREKANEALFHSYTGGDINGFAAMLEEDEAAQIAKHPKVVSVFLNRANKLHTTHSWEFMQLENNGKVPENSIWNKAGYGEDVIIANIDTGVWPESESFSDEGFGPVPSKWKGFCQNNTKEGVPCNKKLIGSRYFDKFSPVRGLNASTASARDFSGHGTHTLSTAAGMFVSGANVFGVLNGTAKGGAPRARVATYKACWPGYFGGDSCVDGDILAGMESAINDGVDVLSLSLGRPSTDYFNDSIGIGAFHAVKNGIVVVCSAGNYGLLPGTVVNVAPWIITVAASTMDRTIENYVDLNNGKRLTGTTISKSSPGDLAYPLISGEQAKAADYLISYAKLCQDGSLDHDKVKGKILVCVRGSYRGVVTGVSAALAGAVGMILCNDVSQGNRTFLDAHVLPAANINYIDGLSVFQFINSTEHPMASISASTVRLKVKPAPVIATFSSTGPNTVTEDILKPDVTAPGVNVIAAYSLGAKSPTEIDSDKRHTSYAMISGTSMSCPHVAGVVGLLKKIHPDWSPAAIKSAIMTTDNTGNPILRSTGDAATPLNYGAGHIQPNLAMDPGLVYDLSVNDYLYFLCAIGYEESKICLISGEPYTCPKYASLLNFNYPSITVHNVTAEPVTVSRKLKNVGSPGAYKSQIYQPLGFLISVNPDELKFNKIGEEKSFQLTLKKNMSYHFGDQALADHYFGELSWSDGHHYVRSPIVVL